MHEKEHSEELLYAQWKKQEGYRTTVERIPFYTTRENIAKSQKGHFKLLITARIRHTSAAHVAQILDGTVVLERYTNAFERWNTIRPRSTEMRALLGAEVFDERARAIISARAIRTPVKTPRKDVKAHELKKLKCGKWSKT